MSESEIAGQGREQSSRVVPATPLRLLYRELRGLSGSSEHRYQSVLARLHGRKGPNGAAFLSELFVRSRSHMSFYRNEHEPFYPTGSRPIRATNDFAKDVVELMTKGPVRLEEGLSELDFVDYEIGPLRTTSTCFESGNAATSSGAGGIDLLLVSGSGRDRLPAIGEIKARSESVGPTFALIQSLTYAAEMVSDSQWVRLGRHYQEKLGDICVADHTPMLDIIILLETPVMVGEDLETAQVIARDLLQYKEVGQSIRRINFLEAQIEANNTVCLKSL